MKTERKIKEKSPALGPLLLGFKAKERWSFNNWISCEEMEDKVCRTGQVCASTWWARNAIGNMAKEKYERIRGKSWVWKHHDRNKVGEFYVGYDQTFADLTWEFSTERKKTIGDVQKFLSVVISGWTWAHSVRSFKILNGMELKWLFRENGLEQNTAGSYLQGGVSKRPGRRGIVSLCYKVNKEGLIRVVFESSFVTTAVWKR